jgi:arylsulfatase A-like enzyme
MRTAENRINVWHFLLLGFLSAFFIALVATLMEVRLTGAASGRIHMMLEGNYLIVSLYALGFQILLFGIPGALSGLVYHIFTRSVPSAGRYRIVSAVYGINFCLFFLYEFYASSKGVLFKLPVSWGHRMLWYTALLVLSFAGWMLFSFLSRNLLKRAHSLRWLGVISLVIVLFSVGCIWYFPAHKAHADLSNCTSSAAGTDRSMPNIILITIDTLRSDFLGCYGNDSISTPEIDRLAEEGVLFERCQSPVPITLPSHASILSATYPLTHGLRNNGSMRLSPSISFLAEVLSERGYLTAAFVSSFVLDARFGLNSGFDCYEDRFSNLLLSLLNAPVSKLSVSPVLRRVNLSGLNTYWRRGNETVERVVDWLEKDPESPCFLWVHLFDPHDPLCPPPPFDTMYLDDSLPVEMRERIERGEFVRPHRGKVKDMTLEEKKIVTALYKGEVSFTDRQVGILLRQCAARGLLDNAIVVLTSDHGQSLFEHDFFGHAEYIYEQTLSIPLIFMKEGTISGGRRVSTMTESLDIAPTILAMAGIPVPPSFQGRSLVPLIERRGFDGKDIFLSESLFSSDRNLRSYGLREGEWKYIRPFGGGDELYRLSVDPGEEENLSILEPDKATRMSVKLDSVIAQYRSEDVIDEEEELSPFAADALKALGYIQ